MDRKEKKMDTEGRYKCVLMAATATDALRAIASRAISFGLAGPRLPGLATRPVLAGKYTSIAHVAGLGVDCFSPRRA